MNLSADIFCDADGKKWTAVICQHPEKGGIGKEIWRREGMRTSHNAETAMEEAWQRFR